MGSGEDQDEDKHYDPTPKKLEDARKKGDVPVAPDLATAAGYGGLVLVGAVFGAATLSALGAYLASLLENADRLSDAAFGGSGARFTGELLAGASWRSLAWVVGPAILVVAVLVAQNAVVFAPTKIQPKLSRISLLSNAKQKFGRAGMFQFAKSFAKLVAYGGALFAVLALRIDEILASAILPGPAATVTMLSMALDFMAIAFGMSLAVGFVDLLWQRAEHVRKNRMSHKEMTDENKESEGDPHMKGQRRRRAEEIATNRMMADVPKADVVVVNPTHYAVALKWDRKSGRAPVCVARGVDEIAARIRESAHAAGVPIHRDPPTARALHATLDVGDEIAPDHYRAVAAAIRFAEAMRAKARARGDRR